MDVTKLNQIINEKNQDLERKALRTAEQLIEQIAQQQSIITEAEEQIIELRKQLKTLTIKQLDNKIILGE